MSNKYLVAKFFTSPCFFPKKCISEVQLLWQFLGQFLGHWVHIATQLFSKAYTKVSFSGWA